jgi:RpiR family carbohydrate utilization transcriptional regulator
MPRTFARQTDFLSRLRDRAARLPRAERGVARVILEDPEAVLALSISELAERSGVADATVVRLARRLGLSGFQEMKLLIAADRSQEAELTVAAPPGDGLAGEVERLVGLHLAALRATQDLLVVADLEAVAERLSVARLVELYGVGTSALAARYLAYRLIRMGVVAHFEEDAHYQAMGTVLADPGCVAVAFSQSGSTYSVVGALKAARDSGAFTVAVTRFRHAPLTAAAAVTLLTGADETPYGSGALSGLISQLCVADVLAVATGRRQPEKAQAALRLSAERLADMKF